MTFASGQNLAGSATINSAVAFSGGNIVSGTATLNSTVSLGGALTVNGTLAGTAAHGTMGPALPSTAVGS